MVNASRLEPSRPVVWIVDDSPMEGEAVRRALATDFEPVVFADGSAVLERSYDSPLPDALVLDWLMPGMSGVEVCRFLRSKHDRLPVLVLTVQNEKSHLAEALGAGANDFVSKPFSAVELQARVRALIETRRLFERAEQAERARAEAERQRAEAAEERARLNELFLAMLGHDLRNPVATIHFAAEALAIEESARTKKVAATLRRASQRMSEMITTLLDVTRARLGAGIPIQRVPTDLGKICEQVIGELSTAYPQRSILFERPPQPVELSADPNRLAQVLGNLVSNALIHGDAQAPVRVELSADPREAKLMIVNRGAPIAPDLLPRLFEPFLRSDPAKAGDGGVRLGLHITQQIVAAHHGRIEVSSGDVTAFTVRLPMP